MLHKNPENRTAIGADGESREEFKIIFTPISLELKSWGGFERSGERTLFQQPPKTNGCCFSDCSTKIVFQRTKTEILQRPTREKGSKGRKRLVRAVVQQILTAFSNVPPQQNPVKTRWKTPPSGRSLFACVSLICKVESVVNNLVFVDSAFVVFLARMTIVRLGRKVPGKDNYSREFGDLAGFWKSFWMEENTFLEFIFNGILCDYAFG